ncbi:MAG: DUF362 domain-containing protein [Christensenellales bacterium]|jgi:uncharacterized protein (DUF362 family)
MRKDQIAVIYGTDAKKMAYDLMKHADIASQLEPGMSIGLKPNLVLARPSDSGATTTPGLLEGAIDYLQENGHTRITILESSWIGDSTKRAFKVCGFEDMARRKNVRLLDLKGDKTKNIRGMNVCQSALELDYLINFPVLKGHCQTVLTCALKNMKGCIPDSEKRRFHTQGLHKPIATLATIIRPHLNIVDGLNGDLNFEEGGNPVPMNRALLGFDSVLVDAYACRLMGIDLDEVDYIAMAAALGAGSMDIAGDTVIELNQDTFEGKRPVTSRHAQRLAKYIQEDQACSACYGSLIHALHRLENSRSLRKLKGPIRIGQGFKGKGGDIGVGKCTAGCMYHVGGCPPRADQIIEMIESL